MATRNPTPIRDTIADRKGLCTIIWRRYFEQFGKYASEVATEIPGQSFDGGAGTVGKVYYLTGTDTWSLSDKDTEATVSGQVGVCTAASSVTFSKLLTSTAHGFTVGNNLYVWEDGTMTDTFLQSFGDSYCKIVGTVEDDDTLRISISSTYYTVDAADQKYFLFQDGNAFTFQDGTLYEFN